MTADEARWYYNNAREKYEEAIFYKNEYNKKIFQSETERKQKNVQINELYEKHSRFIKAQEDISGTDKREQIESDLKGVNREFGEASEFFRSIASMDNQTIDLASHIIKDDDMQKSSLFIEQIFSGIGKAKTDINITAETLEKEIAALENEIEDISREIIEMQNELLKWENVHKKQEDNMLLYKALEKKLLGI